MTEAKWTCGPWLFHEPWAGFSKITGPNDVLIFGIAAGLPEEKRPDAECRANARLIAAAPDMALYVKKRANAGDAEAAELWEAINGNP